MTRKPYATYTKILEGDAESPRVAIGFRVYLNEDEDGRFFSVSQFDPDLEENWQKETEVIEDWCNGAQKPPTMQQILEQLGDEYSAAEESRYDR